MALLIASSASLLMACGASDDELSDIGPASAGGSAGVGEGGMGGAPMSCEPGQQQICYDGSSSTYEVGNCSAGTRTCSDDGSRWGVCEGQLLPAAEACDVAGDEDCDGIPCSETIFAASFSSTADSSVNSVVATADGVLVGGDFNGTLEIGSDSHTSVGSDGFIAKFDSAGKLLWSQRFGGPGTDRGFLLATDPLGNIIVTGSFDTKINFGTTRSTQLIAEGDSDAFLAKLGPDGSHLWSSHLTTHADNSFNGPTGEKSPKSIALDAEDNIVVAGSYSGHWGGLCSLNACESAAAWGAFVARYSSDGERLWRRLYDGPHTDLAQAVAAHDAIYLGGQFGSSLQIGETKLMSIASASGWLAKLSLDGEVVWARDLAHGAADATQQVLGLEATPLSVLVAGRFGGGMDLGDQHNAQQQDAFEGFVALLNDAGEVSWIHAYAHATPWSIKRDSAANIIFAGELHATMDFGGGPLGNDLQAGDALLVKLDPSGAHLWSNVYGGATSGARSLSIAKNDTIAVTGYYDGALNIGTVPLPHVEGASATDFNGFVAQIYP